MAKTFEELVEMRRAANEAHAKTRELREKYGPPTVAPWSKQQTDTYETAWRAWRDLDRDMQAEVATFAKERGKQRGDIEAEVQAHAGKPVEGA